MKTIAKILIILLLLIPAALIAETNPEIDVERLFAEKKAFIKEAITAALEAVRAAKSDCSELKQ